MVAPHLSPGFPRLSGFLLFLILITLCILYPFLRALFPFAEESIFSSPYPMCFSAPGRGRLTDRTRSKTGRSRQT
jgi:hypothetical protein